MFYKNFFEQTEIGLKNFTHFLEKPNKNNVASITK